MRFEPTTIRPNNLPLDNHASTLFLANMLHISNIRHLLTSEKKTTQLIYSTMSYIRIYNSGLFK